MGKGGAKREDTGFTLVDVVKKFSDFDFNYTLVTLGYDLSHLLFDKLASVESEGLTIKELREAAQSAAVELGKDYIIIDKRKYGE